MASAPDGSNFDASFFNSTGNGDGRTAANSMSGSSTKANALAYYKGQRQGQFAGWQISSSEWAAYDSGFSAGWDATLGTLGQQGYKSPGGLTPAQVQAQKEKDEEAKKTIEEWEQTTDIPSWAIAQSVAVNFDNDAMMFESDVSDATAKLSMTMPQGPTFLTKVASFATQWQAVFAAIKNKSVYTPSSAVAEVRKARATMNALQSEMASILAKGTMQTAVIPTPTPSTPVPTPTPAGPAVPSIASKASGMVQWIAAGVGVVVAAAVGMFVFRKKEEDPKPPQKPVNAAR